MTNYKPHSLARFVCLIILIALVDHYAMAIGQAPEIFFGAEPNPTGNPIGGGKDYRQTLGLPNYTVRTTDELLTALGKAKTGEVIYIDDAVEINLTGKREIIIPGGVTLASGRGKNDSKGALLFTTEDKYTNGNPENFHLFTTGGPNVRITGLRLQGPHSKGRGGTYTFINSVGILNDYNGLEVDNCEIWAWSHSGVFARAGNDIHIHHNFIHHVQRAGLGYGIVLDQAEALIEANIFDYYRHAIAATGRLPSGYEARYNIAHENAKSHVFDMHGGSDRNDGTDVAGDWVKIHHNTFYSRQTAIKIRGRPNKKSYIHHNWFVNFTSPNESVKQREPKENLKVYLNAYSQDKTIR